MSSTQTERKLKSIVNNEAKAYAIYTVENRAIPNMIDGFKPVQRFMIYRAIELAKGNKEKMHKLASLAGGVADAGYHHGEVSAQEAGALMANTWNNNVPFLDGEGNFGSRLVQKAAASRYVFCRISENFRKIYKDSEIALEHEDKDHKPPKFYLPIIPTVLLNGVRGIATGYATSILPRNYESVVKSTLQAVRGETIDEPIVEFPQFKGDVVLVDGKYELHGKYTFQTKLQMYISEIPYSFDRATYIEKVLTPLEDKGEITYDDDCSKAGFGFKVKFKKEYNLPDDPDKRHAQIMKDFKLIEKASEYIVVIDENGRLRDTFENASQLIAHFVEVRKSFTQKRIEHMIVKSKQKLKLAVAKTLFIQMVNNGSITIKGKKKKELMEELPALNDVFVGHEEQLVNMNIYHMTDDEVERLRQQALETKKELEYWESTTVQIEYEKDLMELLSV